MTDKQGAFAELETSSGQSKADLFSTKKELGATIQYIDALNTEYSTSSSRRTTLSPRQKQTSKVSSGRLPKAVRDREQGDG